MARFQLVPHPDHPPHAVESIWVEAHRKHDGAIWIEYALTGSSGLALPAEQSLGRADDLWKTTCFELFFRPARGERYVEFNFSPSFQWAAYAFEGYREGRRNLAAEDPEIEVSVGADPHFFLAAEPWPADILSGDGAFGFTAVIEETDGTKSYWALAHPPGAPDFHHPACFAATLPPPAAP